MKFLGDLVKVAEGKYRVGLIHNMPFDPVHGLGKSEEELRQIWYLLPRVFTFFNVPHPQLYKSTLCRKH